MKQESQSDKKTVMRREPLLDFIVIGASKSGTTSLFRYLQTHPDLALPPDKDAPVFDDPWFEGDPVGFLNERLPKNSSARLRGTVTPRYMERAHFPERIHRLCPNARLIALLRHPIDRAQSAHRQQRRRGKEERSFFNSVCDQLGSGSSERVRTMPGETQNQYLVFGEYHRILRPYLDLFGNDKLLVLFTEDLRDRPAVQLERAFAHLGVDPSFRPPNLGKQYHRGGESERFPNLVRNVRQIPLLRSFWRLLPKSRRGALWTWFFTQANVRTSQAETIPAETRALLTAYFSADVARLASATGTSPPWPDLWPPT
jgi:hypothetical protein